MHEVFSLEVYPQVWYDNFKEKIKGANSEVKKFGFLVLLIIMIVAAAACSGGKESGGTSGESGTSSPGSGSVTEGETAPDDGKGEEEEMKTSYLFAYFRGNDQENLCYGVSRDGHNFRCLNGGREVFT